MKINKYQPGDDVREMLREGIRPDLLQHDPVKTAMQFEMEHLTGFAPYTPVTVSSKTKPTTATAIANRLKYGETIRDELWDGFNPYGSGPEPIGPRES